MNSPGASPITESDYYDPSFYEALFAIEDQHFWFQARNRIIETLVRQIVEDWEPGYRVLEVGCGTGAVLQTLEKTCHPNAVIGMDLFGEVLQFARRRTSCELMQADLNQVSFETPFNLIGTFDVLEHIPDDLRALRDIHRLLAPDGVLLLTVPAHTTLWSYFDEASRHQRRYSRAELETRLNDAGFQIEYITQFMALLFPLMWIGRRLAARRPKKSSAHDLAADDLRIMPGVNGFLKFLLSQEAHLIGRRYHLPIGTSWIALARKRSPSES